MSCLLKIRTLICADQADNYGSFSTRFNTDFNSNKLELIKKTDQFQLVEILNPFFIRQNRVNQRSILWIWNEAFNVPLKNYEIWIIKNLEFRIVDGLRRIERRFTLIKRIIANLFQQDLTRIPTPTSWSW